MCMNLFFLVESEVKEVRQSETGEGQSEQTREGGNKEEMEAEACGSRGRISFC